MLLRMKYEDVIDRVDRYIASDKHQPIIVDLPNIKLYNEMIGHYDVDCNIVKKASSYCMEESLPLMDKLQHSLSILDGIVFLNGLSCYLKLQGKNVLYNCLRSLLDLSLKGKLVVVTYNCANVLSEMEARLFDAGKISIFDGDQDCQPKLYFICPKLANSVSSCIVGIDHLLDMVTFLEVGNTDVSVVTKKTKVDFPNSMFDIVEYSSEYQVLLEQYTELGAIEYEVGTETQWAYLLKELSNYEDWNTFIAAHFGNPSNLANCMNSFAQYDANERWIYFLALATCGVKGNEYLAYIVSKSKTYGDFIMQSYCAILNVSVSDSIFQKYYDERKVITSFMDEYVEELDTYCKQVYSKEENAIFYLTDNTRKEKEHIIELIGKYKYSASQLDEILPKVYCDLATYLKPYNYANDFLNKYFALYKYCKVVNCITDEMAQIVEEQSTKREYNVWLQPRSAYVDKLIKNPVSSVLYFMDAMGAEYLGYLQSKCYENGLTFSANVARCNLPSITSMNKEFEEDFIQAGCKVYSNKDMDELKHGGVYTYDYEDNKLPIHIVEEIDILNKLIAQLKAMPKEQTAYVIADHGATRLAVINETENKWEVSEKGKHSGRCCPKADISEKPQFATEENDFWCLANYDRFKGGRKALVEVHGGATLEEVVVPVVTICKMNVSITCKLVDNKPVMVSFKKKARLRLFVDVDSEDMTISVNGIFYALKKTEIQYQYYAEMPEVKTVGEYSCDVYKDEALVAKDIKFVVKKEGASERKFF